MKQLLPPGWPTPRGYANGILASGPTVFVAGVIGWDEHGRFGDGFLGQFEQVLKNTVAILEAGGAAPDDIVRMTWFVKGLEHYRHNLRAVGKIYRNVIGRHYPAMAVIGIADLVEPEALIEIETTAVVRRPEE